MDHPDASDGLQKLLAAAISADRQLADHFPAIILQDRYGGAYAGGAWLAISRHDEHAHDDVKVSRFDFCMNSGPYGSDPDAMVFWDDPPTWIAAGATPNDAIKQLILKNDA